jgi:hypothetical protein
MDDDATQLNKMATAHPEDVELRHWDLALGTLDKAHLTLMEAERGATWGSLARARYASPWERKLLLDAAIKSAPGDIDVLVLATRQMQAIISQSNDTEQKGAFREDISAFLKEHAAAYETSAHGLAALAEARWTLARSSADKATKDAENGEIEALADRALKLDPKEAQALLAKSSVLVAEGKKQENYELLGAAVAAGSSSFSVYQGYVTAVMSAPKLSAEEKKKALLAVTQRLLDMGEPSRYRVITLIFGHAGGDGGQHPQALPELCCVRHGALYAGDHGRPDGRARSKRAGEGRCAAGLSRSAEPSRAADGFAGQRASVDDPEQAAQAGHRANLQRDQAAGSGWEVR